MPQALRAQGKVYLNLYGHWDNDRLRHLGDQTFNDIWGYTAPDGREYAIFGSVDSIYFAEVTDPRHPVIRDAEAGKYANCVHRDFKTFLNYAYAVGDEGSSSLQIFDLKYLPDSVHRVYDSDSQVYHSHNIFIDDDRLYVAAHREIHMDSDSNFVVTGWPMSVFSLANPERPRLLAHMKPYVIGSTLIFDYVHDVYVRHDTAYLSTGNPGLFIYNFKNPKNPKLIQSIQPPYPGNGYNHSSWLSNDGNTLVFADETWYSPLKIYDVSAIKDSMNQNPDLQFLATFGSRNTEGSIPHNPFIRGHYVFVSYYHEGIVVFDIADPQHPKKVAQYDTYPQNDALPDQANIFKGYSGAWGVYPFFPSGTIAGIDMTNGLFLFRLDTFPMHPNEAPLPDNELNVNVLNNPFSDMLHYTVETNRELPVDVTICDMLGRTLFSKELLISGGTHKYTFSPAAGLANGVYILRVHAGSTTKTIKVIKASR